MKSYEELGIEIDIYYEKNQWNLDNSNSIINCNEDISHPWPVYIDISYLKVFEEFM